MTKEPKSNVEELHKSDSENPESSKKEQELAKELADLKAKYAELDDQYKRLVADQQNMSKRFVKEREDIHKFAAENTIQSILPAIDNFGFAKKSLNEKMSLEDMQKSFDMLKMQLLQCLQSIGLEQIDTKIPFDPQVHEAISKIKDESQKENTIVEVAKEGYKLKGKVIRAASVIVSTQED